jgi:Leucine-rich repeat (LRR) protein
MLNVRENKIVKIMDVNCPMLEELYADGNRLTDISHLNCPNLKSLQLNGNNLTKIDPSLALLPRSCKIRAYTNPLNQQAIDSFRKACKALPSAPTFEGEAQVIDPFPGELQEWSSQTNHREEAARRILNFWRKEIEWVSGPRIIDPLDLSNLNLTSLPSCIARLKTLDKLYIHGNPLQVINPEFARLPKGCTILVDEAHAQAFHKECSAVRKQNPCLGPVVKFRKAPSGRSEYPSLHQS